MINIAIVEDDDSVVRNLRSYITRLQEEKGLDFCISDYRDSQSFLWDYHAQFDLVFLDIELPGQNGMQIAQRIRQTDREVMLIFVTFMSQYAVQSYEVKAFDFIVKPLNYYFFSQKLWRAVQHITMQQKALLLLKTMDGLRRVNVCAIRYVEVFGHNMQIHLLQDTIQLRCSMDEMEEKLKPYHFLRCNACYLLNPRFVDKISENQVHIADVRLPISRSKKKEFLRKLAEYFSERALDA